MEHQCAVLRDNQGRMWNITGRQAPPPPHGEWAVRATGRYSPQTMGYCQQGTPLTDVRWEYTNLRCREGRIQGY